MDTFLYKNLTTTVQTGMSLSDILNCCKQDFWVRNNQDNEVDLKVTGITIVGIILEELNSKVALLYIFRDEGKHKIVGNIIKLDPPYI